MKPQNQVPEVVQPTLEDREDAAKENSPTSVSVNSEPIRVEVVQNAVKFLSHPDVRGTPVTCRRSFLDRKGLTKEEIDEAFRLVPDPPSAVSSIPPAPATNQDTQSESTLTTQSKGTHALPVLSRLHWSQALLAVGLLAISGAGNIVIFKNSFIPRLKSWIRKIVLEEEEQNLMVKSKLKPSLTEEATAAAKAAAAAAADVARAIQDLLVSKAEERRYFGELMNLLKVQVQELKSMNITLRKLEGQGSITGQDNRASTSSSKSPHANAYPEIDSHPVRPLSAPASVPVESSVAPHPKSYMEIIKMIQRGEKLPDIREINDLPPPANHPVSIPRLTPGPKPPELAQSQNNVAVPRWQQENVRMYPVPWGQQQNVGINTLPWWQQQNVRTIDIDNENRMGSRDVLLGNERAAVQPPTREPPAVKLDVAEYLRQPHTPMFKPVKLDIDLVRKFMKKDDSKRIKKESDSESGGGGGGDGAVEDNRESSVVMDTTTTSTTGEIQRKSESGERISKM